MGNNQYVSLQDAALLADKSPQTIRRLVKGSKLRYRKYKTPQGFTYLVEKNSLMNYFGSEKNDDATEEAEEAELVEEFDPIVKEVKPESSVGREAPPSQQPAFKINQYRQEINATPKPPPAQSEKLDAHFQSVMTQLIQQHRDDKKRLFELLEIFQKRILTLEDQIKLLEAPKKKKWWKLRA
jgi:hypothetical protein